MSFTVDWFDGNIPKWTQLFKDFGDKQSLKCLEIGSLEGRSALWMLNNVKNLESITCVDTFEGSIEHDDNLKNGLYDRFMENIKPYGDKVIVKRGLSKDVLKTLNTNEYDFIYVDGSHEAHDVLFDAVLAFDILKIGGIMIFDDYRWEGVNHSVNAFVIAYQKFIKVIHIDHQLTIYKSSSSSS